MAPKRKKRRPKEASQEELWERHLPALERDRIKALPACAGLKDTCRLRRRYQIICSLYTQTGLRLKELGELLKVSVPAAHCCSDARRASSEQQAEQRKKVKVQKLCSDLVERINQLDNPLCPLCQVKINSSAPSAEGSTPGAGNADDPSPPASPVSPRPAPSTSQP